MSAKKNNRRNKRDIQFTPAHNRKPGITKYWKHLNHRRKRRQGKKFNRTMVEERQ
jgi:hypothetical protein